MRPEHESHSSHDKRPLFEKFRGTTINTTVVSHHNDENVVRMKSDRVARLMYSTRIGPNHGRHKAAGVEMASFQVHFVVRLSSASDWLPDACPENCLDLEQAVQWS